MPERYIMRIMMNEFRGRSRRRRFQLVDMDDCGAFGATADATTQVEDADVVARALDTLSPRQQAVVVLRYWADYDDQEIAEILQCRRPTVRSLAARALAKIKHSLEASR